MAKTVKNLPAIWETWVQSLGWEDPLVKGMGPTPVLVWRIPWTEESGGLQSMGSQRGRHDWATFTFTHSCLTFVENTKIAQRQVPTINKLLPPIKPHFEITIIHIFGTNLSSLSYDIVLLCVFNVYYIYYIYLLYTFYIRGRLLLLYSVFPRFYQVTWLVLLNSHFPLIHGV